MSTSGQPKIGLLAASVIGVNAMIGAGIFAMPAELSSIVGPASILSFAVSSIVILSIVLPLGRMAELYPGEGWGYRYPALWAGHSVGLLSSFAYLTGVIIAMGFLVQQLGVWLGQFISTAPSTIGVLAFVVLVALVLAGTEIASWGQYIIAACVFVPLFITGIVCWMHFDHSLLTPFMPNGPFSIATAMPVVLFSLFGFESIASLYSVVDKPRKNVPRAAVIAVLAVVAAYTFFVAGALLSIPADMFTDGVSKAFAQVLIEKLPTYQWLQYVVTIGAVFAIAGTLHSMVWSIGVLLYDVFGKMKNSVVTGMVRAKTLSQESSVILVSLLTLVFALSFDGKALIVLTPLLILPAYLLSLVALLLRIDQWKSGMNFLTSIAVLSVSALTYISAQSVLQLWFV